MIFAVFATRINAVWQIGGQAQVQRAADERGVELGALDAAQHGAKAELDERVDQPARVAMPDWKNARHSEFGQILLAIGPQIGEKNVAVANMPHAALDVSRELVPDESFVLGIRARAGAERQTQLVERQADRFRLPLEQFLADAVMA